MRPNSTDEPADVTQRAYPSIEPGHFDLSGTLPETDVFIAPYSAALGGARDLEGVNVDPPPSCTSSEIEQFR